MTRLKLTTLILATTLTVSLFSEPYSVQPELIDTVQLDDYRKIWGSPDGAFFLQRKSGVEIRQYPGADERHISYKSNQKLITSERGNYYALVSYSNFLPTQLQVTGISLYDRNGSEIWTNKAPGCNAFILSDHAPVAAGIEGAEGLAESRLVFFDTSGEVVGNAKVENFFNGQFSGDAESFFGIAGTGTLMKFSRTGKVVHDYGRAYRYYSSFDASRVAAVSDSVINIFAGDTVVATWKTSPQSLREIRFSRDGRMVAALYTDRLNVYDLFQNSSVVDYSLDDPSYRFFHFDTDPNFNYFVCGANNSADAPETKNTKGRIMLLSAGGSLLWGEEVVYEEWSVAYPEVRIDIDKRVVSMLTAAALQVFKF